MAWYGVPQAAPGHPHEAPTCTHPLSPAQLHSLTVRQITTCHSPGLDVARSSRTALPCPALERRLACLCGTPTLQVSYT